jgi:hypothetical protein
LVGPVRRPYQATPAFTAALCSANSQVMRPPQQKPVTPRREVSWPWPRAQATVASRSPMTWASGTLDTSSDISAPMSV